MLLRRWRALVDLTVVMSVDPDTAMQREQYDHLVPRHGSIMNEVSLREFNRALELADAQYGAHFSPIRKDSQAQHRKAVAADLITLLLAPRNGGSGANTVDHRPCGDGDRLSLSCRLFRQRHGARWVFQ